MRSSRSGRGAVALAGENAAAAAGGEIGRTTAVVRTVTGALAGEVRPLALKESVHRDEVIETAASSASQIVFRDDTKVSLGPNTRLTLDDFVFDPDPAHGKFVMTAAKGALRFVTGKLAWESYEIRAPMLTIGVRGTEFSLVTNDQGAIAVILECPICSYPWQPEERQQCVRENETSIVLERADGQSVTLDRCNECATFLPDGTLIHLDDPDAPGACPDWARDALFELDSLVDRPDYEEDRRDEDPPSEPTEPPEEPSPPAADDIADDADSVDDDAVIVIDDDDDLGDDAVCWVAREVYGADSPEWRIFRIWLLNQAPDWFRHLYTRRGERFATWISDKTLLKKLIRIWMDTRLHRAAW